MTTHTPGPWTIEKTTEGYGVRAPHWGYVAIHNSSGLPHWEEGQAANRLLIAAAPELLVALGNLLATLERADLHDGVCCCGDPMEGHSNPMDCGHSPVDAGQYYGSFSIAEAQAAIAKATGAA